MEGLIEAQSIIIPPPTSAASPTSINVVLGARGPEGPGWVSLSDDFPGLLTQESNAVAPDLEEGPNNPLGGRTGTSAIPTPPNSCN